MAIGIAVMLVALPYESNAIAPIIIAGAIAGSFVAGLIAGYMIKKTSTNSPRYTTDYSAYRNNWNATAQGWKNMFNMWHAHAMNTANMLNATRLYFQRLAERKAIEYVNYSTWNATLDEKLLEETGFYDYAENVTLGFFHDLGLLFKDIVFEIHGIETTDDGNISVVYKYGTETKPLDNGKRNTDVIARLWFGDDDFTSEAWNTTAYTKYEDLGNGVWLMVENTSDVMDLIHAHVHMYLKFYNVSHGYFYVRFSGLFSGKVSGKYYWDGTGWGEYQDSEEKGNRTLARVNGTNCMAWGWTEEEVNDVFDILFSNLNEISAVMKQSGHLMWDTYRNNYGYTNFSDIPADLVPVCPDIALDWENLKNLSYDDALALWYSILLQLDDWDLINKSRITDYDLNISDYKGKIATLTLRHLHNASASDLIFNKHKCYVFVYEKDLTLKKGNIYAIVNVKNLTDMNAYLTAFNKTCNVSTIRQSVGLFDIDTGHYYYIVPDNDQYGYAFYVWNLTQDNKSKEIITWHTVSLGNYTYTTWGWYLTPHSSNVPRIIPVVNDNDIISWITAHKGFLVIASIVLGMLMMAGSRRGSGGYTLGMLLFIAGVGMAFYWYILPAWHGLQNLNPLHWFK